MTPRELLAAVLGPAAFDGFSVQPGLIADKGDPHRIEAVVEFRAYLDGRSVGAVQLTPDEARDLAARIGQAATHAERMLFEDDTPPRA